MAENTETTTAPAAGSTTKVAAERRVSDADRLDAWFTYHPPTKAQAKKYAEVDTARDYAEATLKFEARVEEPDKDRVNGAFRALAEAIVENAPESADRTAALRCVRVARNAANELLYKRQGDGLILQLAISNLFLAKWQANAAIALDGK